MKEIITDEENEIFEKALYFPLVISLLEHDRLIFEKLPLKIVDPYLSMIDDALKAVRIDYQNIKIHMRQHNMKLQETGRIEDFTYYSFINNRYEEKHSYWNIHLRNKTGEFLKYYLSKRFTVTFDMHKNWM